MKNYPKFIQQAYYALSLFGKIKLRIWLWYLKVTGKIGWVGLEYRGIPIIERDDMPQDTMYILNSGISFVMKEHRKKDGTLDFRYSRNKWLKK
jgi:hypothetical protein